ncbi:MAG: hypothetical protein WDA75_05365 [Candidatus Latescibacterota bacterium]
MADDDSLLPEPRESLPADLQGALDALLAPREQLRFTKTSDIRLDGRFGPAYLLATDQRLLAISPNGGRSEVTEVSLAEITGVEVQERFGTGALRVRTASRGTTVAIFSHSLADEFTAVPDRIEALVRQVRPTAQAESLVRHPGQRGHVPKKRCGKCGQVIPNWMGVCPACLDRRRLLGRFLGYTLPYWPLASASLLILLGATFLDLTPPLLLGTLIDHVLTPVADARRSGAWLQRVSLPAFGEVTPTGALAYLVLILLGVQVSRNALGAVRSYLLARLGQQITFDLRR